MAFDPDKTWGPPLTVAQLREALAGCDDDMLVVVDGMDGEGFVYVRPDRGQVRAETVVATTEFSDRADCWPLGHYDAPEGEAFAVFALG